MITAYHSTVLDHPVERVWSLIRDFNNYPAYIDGVTESVIEDNRRGDEVGAVRRFRYGDHWIRQRLSDHSDERRMLSYVGIELFAFPAGRMDDPPSPISYEGTIHLLPIVDQIAHSTNGRRFSTHRRARRRRGKGCSCHGFRNGPNRCGARWRGSNRRPLLQRGSRSGSEPLSDRGGATAAVAATPLIPTAF
jgi:hypothetical protein